MDIVNLYAALATHYSSRLRGLLNPPRTDTAGTHANMLRAVVGFHFDPLQVGHPATLCSIVGVTDIVAN